MPIIVRLDQLNELQDKKKELERLHKPTREKKRYDDPSEFMNSTDLPPKMRRVFEDLRMLKERVKKYKEQVSTYERTISQRDAQILKLQDRNQQLSDTLKQSKTSSKDIKDHEAMRTELERLMNANRDLSEKVHILQRSKDVEARKSKRALLDEQKATQAAREETKTSMAAADAKEREIKRLTVECRRWKKEYDMAKSSLVQYQRHAKTPQTNEEDAMTGYDSAQEPVSNETVKAAETDVHVAEQEPQETEKHQSAINEVDSQKGGAHDDGAAEPAPSADIGDASSNGDEGNEQTVELDAGQRDGDAITGEMDAPSNSDVDLRAANSDSAPAEDSAPDSQLQPSETTDDSSAESSATTDGGATGTAADKEGTGPAESTPIEVDNGVDNANAKLDEPSDKSAVPSGQEASTPEQ